MDSVECENWNAYDVCIPVCPLLCLNFHATVLSVTGTKANECHRDTPSQWQTRVCDAKKAENHIHNNEKTNF